MPTCNLHLPMAVDLLEYVSDESESARKAS